MEKSKFKPYQLAWSNWQFYTESGFVRHIVEVMSFIDEGRYMVRRVPGHPGTLVEMPEAQLEPLAPHQKYRWVQYAVVKGHGQFPTDMLRYDSCVPLNFHLENDQWGYPTKTVLDPSFGSEELIVASATPNQYVRWTEERWRSFLWSLKHLKTEKLEVQ